MGIILPALLLLRARKVSSMGKDFTEFIQIAASENMLHQIAKASTISLEGCVTEDGEHIKNMQMYIAKVSTSVSLAMIQEYHNWLNS